AALVLGVALALAAGTATVAADTPPLAISITSLPIKVAAGAQGELKVTVTPAAGFTLVAAPPPTGTSTPLTLILPASEGVMPLQPAYPDGKKIVEEGGFEYRHYDGPVVIKVPIRVSPEAAAGAHVLKGKLRYHPIHYGSFRKTTVTPFEVTIEVTPAAKGKPAAKEKPATRR
ncbi:MAG TPA: hypothetical protein VJV75_03225, partial [Candidatus Polarisedimenticolia bacterium]|nr:hypothetical protein [Candidatus Polarisedimenticolia bacterium]